MSTVVFPASTASFRNAVPHVNTESPPPALGLHVTGPSRHWAFTSHWALRVNPVGTPRCLSRKPRWSPRDPGGATVRTALPGGHKGVRHTCHPVTSRTPAGGQEKPPGGQRERAGKGKGPEPRLRTGGRLAGNEIGLRCLLGARVPSQAQPPSSRFLIAAHLTAPGPESGWMHTPRPRRGLDQGGPATSGRPARCRTVSRNLPCIRTLSTPPNCYCTYTNQSVNRDDLPKFDYLAEPDLRTGTTTVPVAVATTSGSASTAAAEGPCAGSARQTTAASNVSSRLRRPTAVTAAVASMMSPACTGAGNCTSE